MDILQVEGLSKRYDGFHLDNISFTLPPGYIMGFIGRNGAGKTTTIKAMLDLIHRDSGRVTILGKDYFANEMDLKKEIGLTLGGVTYYPTTKLTTITDVFKRFFDTWDEQEYRSYLTRFDLDEKKKVNQLSAGMTVKYALALALSHHAKLLVLDEPTSGLDPVSRDDLLDLFREIIEEGERSILFSTQITSDLEKCADYITYIRDGKLVASMEADDFRGAYLLVKGRKDQLGPLDNSLIGYKATDLGFTGLAHAGDRGLLAGCEVSAPTIEDIMVYHERSATPDTSGTQSASGTPSTSDASETNQERAKS